MSSKAKKLEKTTKAEESLKKYEMYGSIAGSAIVSIGKLAKKTEKELLKEFDNLRNDENFFESKNIVDMCEYLFKYFNVDEEYKENVILLFDEREMFTPMVTLLVEGTILPLDPEAKIFNGIFANLDKDYIRYEFVFDDEIDFGEVKVNE
jgi:hypothetical protein